MTHFELGAHAAGGFARLALSHVDREFPNKLDHIMSGAEDVRSPRALHPIFFGSFDWHSCVHGWWLMLRVRRLFPDIPEVREIDRLAGQMLTPENVAGELAYLDRPYGREFERPYGWAWLLALHREAQRQPETGWAERLAPLAAAFAARFRDYLPRLTYPVRVGVHSNTAFALVLALEWADNNDPLLAELIRGRARDYYHTDRDCQAWEPCGDDFLSSALIEALCMQSVLGDDGFRAWFDNFLPRVAAREPATLFAPAIISDRTDGKITHLDGLNLSRAWCWRRIATALGPEAADAARRAGEAHLQASLPHVAGDYVGEHWLATYALLALEA